VSAIFGEYAGHRYRWVLGRDGPGGGFTTIVGVNPSTADAETDDQTIRKDKGFGKRYGWGGLLKVNLFGLCATDVRELAGVEDPVGPENDHYLRLAIEASKQVVVAWGRLDKQPLRWRRRWRVPFDLAVELGKPVLCLGTCDDGHPRHTMTLGYDQAPRPWVPPYK
jgi:hypothetical protein